MKNLMINLRPLQLRWLMLTCIIMAFGVTPRTLRADESCSPAHGTITSAFTTANFTSPVGLCTVGIITGAGPLNGTTTFVALAVAPSAGLPTVEPTANLSYSGQLTIVTTDGTLVTRDLGVLDVAHLAFTEIERFASGTGVFASPGNAAFFMSGSVTNNGQGFQGSLSGIVCTGTD